jgi:hypothetical protein
MTSPLFSNLSIEDATLPATRVSIADNPFYPHVKASAEKRTERADGKGWIGAGKSVHIPAKGCVDAERFVRNAADALGVGSSIRFRTTDGVPVTVESIGGKPQPSKDGKTRMSGGKLTPMIGGAKGSEHTGKVVMYFSAKSPRAVKTGKPAAPTATPTAPKIK